MADKLLKIQEVADMLGLSVRTIERMVSFKEIKHIKLGRLTRFEPAEIEKLKKKRTIEEAS